MRFQGVVDVQQMWPQIFHKHNSDRTVKIRTEKNDEIFSLAKFGPQSYSIEWAHENLLPTCINKSYRFAESKQSLADWLTG